MAVVLNRAQIRDRVRRMYLGITPPIDPQVGTGMPVPGASPGDVPPTRPDPSNEVLNDCLEMAVADLNRKCDYHENFANALPIAAAVAGTLGPLFIPLQSLLGDGVASSVRRVVWHDPVNGTRLLMATSWQDQDRLQQNPQVVPAGVPQAYLIEAYNLGLLPAPLVSGTISMLVGSSPFAPMTDAETLQQLPVDHHETVYLGCAIRSLQRIAEDAEAQAKLSMMVPLWMAGIGEILGWKSAQLKSYQPSFGFASYRVGSGLRRNRR